MHIPHNSFTYNLIAVSIVTLVCNYQHTLSKHLMPPHPAPISITSHFLPGFLVFYPVIVLLSVWICIIWGSSCKQHHIIQNPWQLTCFTYMTFQEPSEMQYILVLYFFLWLIIFYYIDIVHLFTPSSVSGHFDYFLFYYYELRYNKHASFFIKVILFLFTIFLELELLGFVLKFCLVV